MAKVNIGYIIGTVGFYGKSDKPNSEEKQYTLRIDNPELYHFDMEAFKAACDEKLKEGKKRNKRFELPAQVQGILSGATFDKMYFNSDYPIKKVWLKDKTELEVENPDLKDIKVMMKYNFGYIGALMCETAPTEYTPNPFNMEDFETEDDLPFN